MKAPRDHKQPELETKTSTEIDPTTEEPVTIVREKRGLFEQESRFYDQIHPELSSAALPSEIIESFCDCLREELKSRGLPSDRPYWWIKIGKEDWKPHGEQEETPESEFEMVTWYTRINSVTESLSEERATANLLKRLGSLLVPNKFTEEQLLDLIFVSDAYANFRILTRYNAPACEGLRSREGRRQGPQKRKDKAAQTRAVVAKHADKYWERYPAYRQQVQMTAEAISPEVNSELREQGLLPKSRDRLTVATIAAHLREAFRGQNSESGH